MKQSKSSPPLQEETIISPYGLQRRNMFKFLGASAAVAAIGISCKKDDNPGTTNNGVVNLGSGDTGILNYAYALEQLEAAFYTQVVATPYASISAEELNYMKDIKDHEIIHREFFKAAIGASAIPALTVNFSSINFNDRTSVLGAAMAFEDLGVNAYNGAGKLISNADYLTLAGKIVSVEARHAALIRDLISNGTFANSVDANGLDTAKSPAEVLAIAGTYITNTIDASNLPTS
ncbi:MAG: ferritin-like domain-containing protein [Ferruginibacter sp.]